MVVVQEEENFWSKQDWLDLLDNYYNPLIDEDAIGNFKWEVLQDDENFYRVRRSFYDWRTRSLDPVPCGGSDRGQRRFPQSFKVNAEVTVAGGDGADAFEFIQNYRDYWPKDLDMKCYAVGQAKDEECYMILSFANYEDCVAEDEEENEDEEDDCGDIDYR